MKKGRDFDYAAMLAGIDNFCFSHAVADKSAKKLRLIAEELVINIVVPRFGVCDLSVSFSERLSRYEVIVTYPGDSEDALATAADDLARVMIHNTAGEIVHTFVNGVNTLRLTL